MPWVFYSMEVIFIVLLVLVGVALLFAIFFLVNYIKIMHVINNYPNDNPFNYSKENSPEKIDQSTKKRIVCVGDSLTHGNLSVNYVEMLAGRLGKDKYDFINAGMNSEVAYNVYKRIDSIIACKPDYVTILIGTNDVHREFDLINDRISDKRLNLPQKPDKQWYRENLEKTIVLLKENTTAKIAVLSLPPLGEDSDAEVFKQAKIYSDIIKEIAEENAVSYLPVNEKMAQFLSEHPSNPKYPFEHTVIKEVVVQHFLFKKSFDVISKNYGFSLLTDNIHLNSEGAKIIADLIEEFILY